jgi:hypothetical protein
MGFAREMTLFRYDLGKGVPVVRIKETCYQMVECIRLHFGHF